MLIGHYGAGFALKKLAPSLSLGVLFITVQFVDILWAVLVLLGVEKVKITPGFTAAVPLEALYQPLSHSLLSSFVLAALIYVLARLFIHGKAGGVRIALVLGVAVLSHFLLDLPVHASDLPLAGWDSYRLGFGLWNHPIAAYGLEWSIFIAGFVLYFSYSRGKAVIGRYAAVAFGILMLALGVFSAFAPPSKSGEELALSLLILYLVAAGLAFYVDRLMEQKA